MSRTKVKLHWLGTIFVVGVALAFVTAPQLAYAQADEAETVVDDEAEQAEEIIITGSMIRRKDLTAPAPVAIIEKMDLDAAGLNSVGDILQNLPSQSNAINVQANNGGNGTTRVNMRGLGVGRTLVLVNGRRHVPGGNGANASVDLNSIPTAIIERVEVLKDGASAIYGSDAIGGVVNIITRKKFEGVEATAYYGGTKEGGQTYDLSVTAGVNSDKGNLVVSANYVNNEPVWTWQRKRSQSDYQVTDAFWDCLVDAEKESDCVLWAGSSGTPEGSIIDRTPTDLGNAAWQAVLAQNTDPENDMYSGRGGWHPFNTNGSSDPNDPNPGDFYNYQPDNYLYTPSERFSLYTAGRYEFSDYVSGYIESTFTNRYSQQSLAPTPVFIVNEDVVISADNVYNPFGRSFADVRRRMVEAGRRIWTQEMSTFRLAAGFEGALPDLGPVTGIYWNTSWQYGVSRGTDTNQGRFMKDRVEAALGPSFQRTDGSWGCGVDEASEIPACVPLDFFGGYNQETGVGTITEEMVDYISYTGVAYGVTELTSITADISGQLFEIPFGGPVGLALGYQYRELSGSRMPDPLEAKGITTGNKSEPVSGKYLVNEVFGELRIPLVSDMAGIEMLELSGAIRAFNYSTFGSDMTYKVGARWHIIPDLTLRGTFSSGFRAPSVGELFSGVFDSFPNVSDPCHAYDYNGTSYKDQRCRAEGVPEGHTDVNMQLRSRIGGNVNLDPETAQILTAGLVFEPSFVEGLSLTLDFFIINIEDAITTIGSSTILSSCYSNPEVADTDPYCKLIHRDAAGYISEVIDQYTNIGKTDTQGLDIQIRYDMQTNVAGRFRFNLEGTWLHQYDETQADGTVVEGLGVYDLGVFPKIKANLSIIWGYEGFGAGYSLRYIAPLEECRDDNCEVVEDELYDPNDRETWSNGHFRRDVDMNITMDIFLSYQLDTDFGTTKFTAGINNFLDQDPPWIYNGFLATSDSDNYDFLGRFFYFRLSQAF